MSRTCRVCQEAKSLEADFYREAKDSQGRQRACKRCISAYARNRRRDQVDLLRDQYLRREYGISLGEYLEMLRGQNGACAVCGDGGKLHVDHDHETGRVRGLLCGSCNRALGLLKDNVDSLKSAIDYLQKGSEG